MLGVEGEATARFLSKLSPARTPDIILHIFVRQLPDLGLGLHTPKDYGEEKRVKETSKNGREREEENPANVNKRQTLCHRLGSPSPSPLGPVGSDPLGRI